jgi:hypothetical protein
MDCTVELASVERVEGERIIATFAIASDALLGNVQLKVPVEAMSGHHAAEQARQTLREFAHALARALESPNVRA